MARAVSQDPLQSYRFAGLGDVGPGLNLVLLDPTQSRMTLLRRALPKDQLWLELSTRESIDVGILLYSRSADLVKHRSTGEWNLCPGRHVWLEGAKVVGYRPFSTLGASQSDVVMEELVLEFSGMTVEDRE